MIKDLFRKLDALTNYHYTPKQVKYFIFNYIITHYNKVKPH